MGPSLPCTIITVWKEQSRLHNYFKVDKIHAKDAMAFFVQKGWIVFKKFSGNHPSEMHGVKMDTVKAELNQDRVN